MKNQEKLSKSCKNCGELSTVKCQECIDVLFDEGLKYTLWKPVRQ